MKIVGFVHPHRCMEPCGGVGRHANEVLPRLAANQDTTLSLLFARQRLGADGRLPPNCPLRTLPFASFPLRENLAERLWKTFGWPRMDRHVRGADWVYSPMETYLPIRSVPVAITMHDIQALETDLPWSNSTEHRRWRRKWSVWLPKAMRDCRVVFTASEFSKRRIVELLGADERKLVVVGNGVDPRFHALADSHAGAAARSDYALVIGGLRMKKGADWVLATARELAARKVPLRLVVAGPNDDGYREAAANQANLQLLGNIPDEQLLDLLGGARALLFLSPYEGFGIPAIEAMAAGVPIVAADRASLPEVVGDAGLLVAPDEAVAVVDALVAVTEDAPFRRTLIAQGRTRAATFTWEVCADRVLRTLREFS